MTGKFFQIDRRVWLQVVRTGLNPAVAYLILACGTGADNRRTCWSVNAIEKYTNIGRIAAKRAIEVLINLGAVIRVEGASVPTYLLTPMEFIERRRSPKRKRWPPPSDPEWIWLPNSLVLGVAAELPPVERLRGLQDVRALQMVVASYGLHELADTGGIHWNQMRASYERQLIAQRGIWNIWGFKATTDQSCSSSCLWDGFRSYGPDAEEVEDQFWVTWRRIGRLGLTECVPHLIEADSEDAALICPVPGLADSGTDHEKAVGEAARRAAVGLLADCMQHHFQKHDIILPVPDRFPKVELVGIYRLRYRPHTRRTAAWARNLRQLDDWTTRFEEVAAEESTFLKFNQMQHQG